MTSFTPMPPLPEGSLLAVIAPAGPARAERVTQVQPFIESLGFRARLFPSCFVNQHDDEAFLAAPDTVRLADLHAALADPAISALWCLRGGYGSGRLLPRIDRALVRRAGKLLIGYSDITALHAVWVNEGLAALHAPMPASDLLLPGREADTAALLAVLRQGISGGQVWAPERAATRLHHPGQAEGLLVGGNLSLVASLLGTPGPVPVAGNILFLEDINEEPYKVDRYFCQLRDAGVLGACSGFLIGSFSEQASPEAVLAEFLLPLNKPVLAGWPSGHGTPNRPLLLGRPVRLDAGAGTITYLPGASALAP
jgi:muramoyltetrapeptide carboxypeptidase